MNRWLGADTVEGAVVRIIEVVGLLLTALTLTVKQVFLRKVPFKVRTSA